MTTPDQPPERSQQLRVPLSPYLRQRAVVSCRPHTVPIAKQSEDRVYEVGGGPQGSRSGRVHASRSPSHRVEIGGRACHEGGGDKQTSRQADKQTARSVPD